MATCPAGPDAGARWARLDFANELAIAVLKFHCEAADTCTVVQPAGYAVRVSEDMGILTDAQVDDLVLTQSGPQTAMWTTGGSGNAPPDWVACIATFAPR